MGRLVQHHATTFRSRPPPRKYRDLLPALSRRQGPPGLGCRGLHRDHPGQAVTPPRKGPPEVHEARRRARHRHSSKRISVEHALVDRKRWKRPTGWTHRRKTLPTTYQAIAGLVPDRDTSPDNSRGQDGHASPAITHQLVRFRDAFAYARPIEWCAVKPLDAVVPLMDYWLCVDPVSQTTLLQQWQLTSHPVQLRVQSRPDLLSQRALRFYRRWQH